MKTSRILLRIMSLVPIAGMVCLAVMHLACLPFPPQEAPSTYPKPYPLTYPPPDLPIPAARNTITPSSQRMRIKVGAINDATGRFSGFIGQMKNVLLTELYRTRRFEIHGIEIAKQQHHTVDAILHCTITSAAGSSGPATVDFRLVNTKSGTVMLASVATVHSFGGDGLRKPLARMARDMAGMLPPRTDKLGRVIVQDGLVITINLGEGDRLIPGMNVFVVAGGARDQNANEILPDDMYVAQAYITAVYETTSQAVVFDGSDYRVGDMVRLK